jgi:CRISPR-associated protein Cmr1
MKSRLPKWHPKDTRIPGIAFPRAEFGMPIIFEIRGEGIKPTLQPNEEHDRMASPLILRPIKFGNGSFASMIIRLHTPILESAYLKPGKTDLACGYTINASQIRDPLNAQYLDSAMTGLCDSGSALDALITLAEKRNFKEV